MKLLCKMFGHQPPSKSKSYGGDYGKLQYFATDGIGRVHFWFTGECPRCEKDYRVGAAHLPEKFRKMIQGEIP